MPNLSESMFWSELEGDLWDAMSSLMINIYLSGIDGGIAALPANIRVLADFDRINNAALAFAKDYCYSKIKGIIDTTRTQTQKAVADWIQSGAPLDALETALESVFGAARAERIAVTEVTRIYAQANQQAWESTGLVDMVKWMTARDDLVCPVCGELDGSEIGIGDVDAMPPAHVNCRCYTQPIVSEEALSRRLDEVLV